MNTRIRLYAAAEPTVLRVIPELAAEIGLNESIMLLQIAYWINTSDNYRDGRWWTYQSIRGMQRKAFTWWSVGTIQNTLDRLVERGLLMRGNYNKRAGDKTGWYALDERGLAALKSVRVITETCSDAEQRCSNFEQGVQTLNNVTREYPEIKESPPSPPQAGGGGIVHANGDSAKGKTSSSRKPKARAACSDAARALSEAFADALRTLQPPHTGGKASIRTLEALAARGVSAEALRAFLRERYPNPADYTPSIFEVSAKIGAWFEQWQYQHPSRANGAKDEDAVRMLEEAQRAGKERLLNTFKNNRRDDNGSKAEEKAGGAGAQAAAGHAVPAFGVGDAGAPGVQHAGVVSAGHADSCGVQP